MEVSRLLNFAYVCLKLCLVIVELCSNKYNNRSKCIKLKWALLLYAIQ